VGQGQLGPGGGQLAVDEQVDVQPARPVARSAAAPGGELESLGQRQQLVGAEPRPADDGGVQIRRLRQLGERPGAI